MFASKNFKLTILGSSIFYLSFLGQVFSQDINQILTRMQEANALVKYKGTLTTVLINNPFNKVYRYKIENYGTILRREELITTGSEKEIDYDDGKNLWRFFPKQNLVIKETSKITRNLEVKNKEILKHVKENYQIKILKAYKANNRNGYEVLFLPITGDRPKQIFWIDSETGIPFKIEKYGANDELLSVTSFSEIDFQVTPKKENLFLMVPPNTEVNEVKEEFNLTLEQAKDKMGNEISIPSFIPNGFILNNIILRSLGGDKTVHFFYTDGLSSFSVFQKNLAKNTNTIKTPYGNLNVQEKSALITSSGTMNIVSLKSEHITKTVMGEVFKDSILKIAESLTPIQEVGKDPIEVVNSPQEK